LRVFPDELTLVFLYSVTSTIFTTTVGLLGVPNASAWKLGLNISLISIFCSVRYHANCLFLFEQKDTPSFACVVY